VWPNARHIKLPIPVGDEIITISDSLLQRIQWPRQRILIPPRSRDPNSTATSAGTGSDGATLDLRQQKEAQQKPHLSQQPENKMGPHQPENQSEQLIESQTPTNQQ